LLQFDSVPRQIPGVPQTGWQKFQVKIWFVPEYSWRY